MSFLPLFSIWKSTPVASSGLSPIDSEYLRQSEGRICDSPPVGLF